jgi:opacity protein-like surface antigen
MEDTMRKLFISSVLVAVLSFSTLVYAQGAGSTGYYIGIGGSYAFENFDADDDIDLDFDDTWGLNVKAGYRFSEQLALEFNFDYLSEFEADTRVRMFVPAEAELQIITYMIVGKFWPWLSPGAVKPFFDVGIGFMDADLDIEVLEIDVGWESETDLCAKLGGGVDFFIAPNVSIGAEGSYVWGFGDLDEIEYFNLTLGIAYHF